MRVAPPYIDRLLGDARVEEFARGSGLPRPSGLAVWRVVRIDASRANGSSSLAAYTEHVRLGDALDALVRVRDMRAEREARLRALPALWDSFQRSEKRRGITSSFGLLDAAADRVYTPAGFTIENSGSVYDRAPSIDIAAILERERSTPREFDRDDHRRERARDRDDGRDLEP